MALHDPRRPGLLTPLSNFPSLFLPPLGTTSVVVEGHIPYEGLQPPVIPVEDPDHSLRGEVYEVGEEVDVRRLDCTLRKFSEWTRGRVIKKGHSRFFLGAVIAYLEVELYLKASETSRYATGGTFRAHPLLGEAHRLKSPFPTFSFEQALNRYRRIRTVFAKATVRPHGLRRPPLTIWTPAVLDTHSDTFQGPFPVTFFPGSLAAEDYGHSKHGKPIPLRVCDLFQALEVLPYTRGTAMALRANGQVIDVTSRL
ncbi:hypothetical protein JAAARDRAFT_62074 [Jaapia argillacea MUCL 33604]|uniref:Uncharacterized protein n=1 Tax=Jaapia argillacea MUCL 33604 TaxID=933084 RepID=A0A067PAW9_9AGAM|nr:hypothetical protein JAAARDRAFT_62074 [Jaapia argillacea MUCL 33604]